MSELLRQIKQLSDAIPSPRWKRVLDELYVHMRLPMQDVLAKVPGESVGDKVAAIGVSRTAYHEWMRESFRPNRFQAAKLAELTGFSAEAIHGQTEEDNDPRRTNPKTAATVASGRKPTPRVHGRTRRIRRRVDDAPA